MSALSAHEALVSTFDRSLISQATPFAFEAWETIVRLEERKVVGRVGRDSFAVFAAVSYYVSTCQHAVYVSAGAFAEH